MTKADIVRQVHEELGFSKKDASKIVESLFDMVKDNLEQGKDVKIPGFGRLSIRQKKARRGRNPQTGQEITIAARRVLTFKPSKVLRKGLNP